MERRRTRNRESNVNVNIPENGNLLSSSASVNSTMNSIKGDRKNIALLLLLYTLQGIPLGLSSAIPMILQNRGVTYKQQAEFSFVTWPFSLKLLWAPLVDALYSSRLGRRKTWLIPTQYLIGIFMLVLSMHVNQWLGDNNGSEPNIFILTQLFFILNFLAATQDIAVDGWALTMLKKQNLGHASTCNSIGQTTGFLLSYVLFMALESSSFCNMYLRDSTSTTSEGLVTLPGFLYFWGWVFIVTTTIIALLKKEVEPHDSEHEVVIDRDVGTAYSSLLQILKLKPVQILVFLLLTAKIGFSSTDSVMTLKLVEMGIPKERLGLMAIPLIPVQLAMPIIIAKYTTGPKPLDIYLKAFPYRLAFAFVGAFLVFITPILVPDGTLGLPFFYVAILIVCYGLHQVCVYAMFVAQMAFFAKVSDSSVGGTYMTLLNTVTNLGGNWPAILALYFVDPLTYRQCEGGMESFDNKCRDGVEKTLCLNKGGKCETVLDGFYIETLICVVIGFIWLSMCKKRIQHLQSLDDNAWMLNKRTKEKT